MPPNSELVIGRSTADNNGTSDDVGPAVSNIRLGPDVPRLSTFTTALTRSDSGDRMNAVAPCNPSSSASVNRSATVLLGLLSRNARAPAALLVPFRKEER